jgi:DNA polymerase-3 subunit alpha
MSFVHLHLHSEYSLRDSTIKIANLIKHVKELGVSTIALTDHGNTAGILEFIIACKDAGIKPIVGMEAYIAKDIEVKDKDEHRFHGTLIAVSEIGCKNLFKLSSIANTVGFYYQPRLDFKTMKQYSEGLVLLTGCINSLLYIYGVDRAELVTRLLKTIFSEVWLEIMPHDIREQKLHNIRLLQMASKCDCSLIATQDVHYLNPADAEVHGILMKIQEREPYEVESFYLTTVSEMYKQFQKNHKSLNGLEVIRAIKNAGLLAERVEDYNISLGKFEYPIFNREE